MRKACLTALRAKSLWRAEKTGQQPTEVKSSTQNSADRSCLENMVPIYDFGLQRTKSNNRMERKSRFTC